MLHFVDLLIVIGFFIAAAGCGIWLLKSLRIEAAGRFEYLFLAIAVGMGTLAYVPFVLGVSAILFEWTLHLLYWVILLVGLSGWTTLLWPYSFKRSYMAELRHLPVLLKQKLGQLSIASKLLLAFLLLLSLLNLLAAMAPVIGVDELIYRVSLSKIYLRHHEMSYLPSIVLHQQPQQIQMLQLWGMSLGSDSTSQVIQWGMGVVLLMGLIDFGRRYMPLSYALLAGAAFYAVSDVVLLSARASPDLANALFLFAAILSMLRWVNCRNIRWVLLAGVLSGFFAAGSRVTGAYGPISLALGVVVIGFWTLHHSGRRSLFHGALLGIIALAMVIPWLIKSWIQAGNPVWPYFNSFFGGKDWTEAAVTYFLAKQEHDIGNWLSFPRFVRAPWDLTMYPRIFNSGVAGPLALGIVPLLMFFKIPRDLRYGVLLIGVSAVAWYLSYPRIRAFLPLLALTMIVTSYLYWKIIVHRAMVLPVRTVMGVFVVAWLLFGFGTVIHFHFDSIRTTLGFQQESDFLSRRLAESDMHFFWYEDYQNLNQFLPESSRVLLYERRGMYLHFDYERYDLIAFKEKNIESLSDPTYVSERVNELNINYVILQPELVHITGFVPSIRLAETLYRLCGQDWPIIYRSETMIVCEVAEAA